jgi:hypothetical protein
VKKHGIIYADIGGINPWNLIGTPDTGSIPNIHNELRKVVGSDLEAVDESSLMIDPDSGQARPQPDQ